MPSKPFTYKYDGMEFTKFIPKLRKELLVSLAIFGKKASGNGSIGLTRHLTRSQGYDSNNPWWHKAKNRKRVFYDSGFWRSKPSYQILPTSGDVLAAVEVGFVNKLAHPSERQSGGMDVQRIAEFLVKESKWTPSAKQRQGFWATIRRRGVKVNKSEIIPKSTYTSPARDFVSKHLKSPKVIAEFVQQIDRAVKRTYKTTPRKKVSG